MENNNNIVNQSLLDKYPEWMRERIDIVAQELLNGLSPRAIGVKYSQKWDCAISTIAKGYCQKARQVYAETALKTPDEIKNDLTSKYENLYRLNMEQGNYQEARKILDSVSRLFFGDKLDVTSGGLPLTNIRLIEITDQQNIIDIEPNESDS